MLYAHRQYDVEMMEIKENKARGGGVRVSE
jgi:hypothetical protein